jgi:hypothetical protein
MKTAMQELIDEIKLIESYPMNPLVLRIATDLLEKEKEQIIEAGDACSLKAIAYHQKLSEMSKDELEQELVKDGMTHGEDYYNQTFNQNK